MSATRAIGLFLLVTFGISWGLVGITLAVYPAVFDQPAALIPLFFLGVYAPAIAGLVTARACGHGTWRAYLGRLLTVRGTARWTVSVVSLLLATHLIASAVGVAAGQATVAWPFSTAGAFLLVLLLSPLTDPGGMEELGWRGWLQPALQTWIAPLPAALVVGVIWGLWHLPVLVIPEFPQHDPEIPLWLSVMQFTVQTTALAVILAVLLNATRGAVLPAFIAHWAVNLPWAIGLAEGTMTAWTGGVVVLAVALGWLRRDCLRPSAAITLR